MKYYKVPLILALCALLTGCRIENAPAPNDTSDTAAVTEAPPSGSVGIAYTPNYYDDTCTVLGIGSSTDTALIIPAEIDGFTVTAIDREAFRDCTELTSVTLPDTLTRIGAEAFAGCTGLGEITLPASVVRIGRNAFTGCSNLESVVLTVPQGWTVRGSAVNADLSDGAIAAGQLRLLADADWVRGAETGAENRE